MLAGLQNVTFEFGARTIVRDATWHIQPAQRIGLIGYNGTGKSTLLKLLAGEYQPSAGTVERSRNTSIGYLHQDLLSFDTSESILEVALHAFDKVKAIEKDLEKLVQQLEKDPNNEPLLHQYSERLHDLEEAGGYDVQHKTEEVLQGLGFSSTDLQRPYREFSGGWRMRVLLAKMILQQPDLLLLDEPTNHLDLPSIEWLEKYLQHYKGAVVMVSHDKFFLNRMVKEIVELYQKELHFYSGNYSYYETEKEQRVALQQRAFENQQDYIRQQERFIERFKAKASKAAQAQSVMKRLDKLERIEGAEIERPNIKINFNIDKTPGKVLVELKHVTKQFPGLTIVEDADAEIERDDKIALVGANGKGKSTLLRIIAGRETFTGERKWGHNIDAAFYAQHQLEALNLDHTILEEMKAFGTQKTELELRTLLGCFLFGGDDVDKKIKVLSGGEKARVALAKTMVSRANFLLLDEPTNHLDLPSIEWLEKYLQHYKGAVVMVSHDKFFLNRMVKEIVELYQKELHFYSGNYSYYETEKEQRVALQQRAFENQQDYIRQQERFIERFKAKASKAAQAQSVMKRLDKLERIEGAEIERPNIKINFNIDKTPGKVLVELKHVTKQFPGLTIVEDADAEIERDDKIALVGANGKGKSTLLRIIAGRETFTGERKWGHNIDAAFYAQHQLEALNLDHTILEEMKAFGTQKTELELRTLLGCFLFGGDDVDKKIKVLSGGEKARVALAKTMVSRANFLLLDEPTNHLDIHSSELLIDALNRYQGTYILVSHDRYFISRTANKIWEIVDHKIKEFKGTYQEWVEWKERMEKAAQKKNNEIRNTKPETKKPEEPKPVKTVSASAPSNLRRELEKQQKQFKQLEEKLARFQTEKSTLEAKLASPDIYKDPQLFKQTESDYQKLTKQILDANNQYEQVFEKILALESELS